MNDRLRGILLAFFGMVAISTDSLFTRFADAEGFDVAFWVGVLTGATMLGAVLVLQRGSPLAIVRQQGTSLLLAAVLQAVSTLAFVLAVKHTSIANVVVIIAAAPLITAIVSRVWLGEQTSVQVWLAIALAISGIAIVISGSIGGGSLEGDLMAVCAVVAYSFNIVLLRARPDTSRTMMIGLGGLIMAAIAFLPATLFGHTTDTWIAVVAIGAIFGPAARVMLGSATRYLPAAEVALFAPVETVFGILWAVLFFSEEPSALTWLGGAIVLAGLLWGIWPRGTRSEGTMSPRSGESLP